MGITPTRKQFGKRLRILRKKAGLSQEELGFKSGLHRTYIGSIERAEQNISVDNIHKLAKALKVSADELFK
jgi:transcriptional regulator with XRE-family HTH domain